MIVGHISVPIPESSKITVTHVETTEEMLTAVKKAFSTADVLIMAAAVADYSSGETVPPAVIITFLPANSSFT